MAFTSFNTFSSNQKWGGGVITVKEYLSSNPATKYNIISTTNLFLYYSFDSISANGNYIANYATGSPVYDASLAGISVITGNKLYSSTYGKAQNGLQICQVVPCSSYTGLSFALWFYPTLVDNNYYFLSTLQDINGYPSGNRFYICIDLNNKININGTAISYTITANSWYHCVVTINSSGTVIVYMNNVAYSTTGIYPNFTNISGYNYIAHDPAGFGIVGYVDEYRLYNRIVNSTEVATLYNSGHN